MTIRQNEVRDSALKFLAEVCIDVKLEPSLIKLRA